MDMPVLGFIATGIRDSIKDLGTFSSWRNGAFTFKDSIPLITSHRIHMTEEGHLSS